MSSRAFLGALAAAFTVASGCGDGSPRGPRVEVVVSSVDQPGPASYFLRALAGDGGTYPLERVKDARPNVYEAPSAPDGPYAVEGAGGWGMLWQHQRPPDLRRSAPEPTPVQVGRPKTLYVARESHAYRFGTEWAAFPEPTGEGPHPPPEAISLTAALDEAGVAVVRIPEERWKGKLRAYGRLEGGGVTLPIVFESKESGRPTLQRGRAAPTIPLRVLAFAGDGSPLPNAPLRVAIEGLPFTVAFEGTVRDGVASFAAVPFLDVPLRVSSPAFGGEFVLTADVWRAAEELRVVVPGPDARERVLRIPGAPEPLEVHLRSAAASSYGLVAFRRSGDEVTLRVPPGDVRLLLHAGDSWAAVRVPPEGQDWIVPSSEFQRATQVRTPLQGARDGHVFLERIEDDRPVLAQGFVHAVSVTSGDTDPVRFVPPGTYRLRWKHSRGEKRIPTALTLEPGGQAVIPLDAR